jgi:hypothetical protein
MPPAQSMNVCLERTPSAGEGKIRPSLVKDNFCGAQRRCSEAMILSGIALISGEVRPSKPLHISEMNPGTDAILLKTYVGGF